MLKSIPFDLFEQGQTIYFDIKRLEKLELIMGVPINTTIRKGNAGIHFCLAGLLVGLQHENPKATADFYADKIDEYFDNGGTLDELAIPIVRAILASGIFGKQKETEEKNA
ncbi:hypothetical protein SOV_50850 [Sporomusa ovata DSM 2662]|uniref:Uncharacterized protein n=1 Tax=Sporomusa ovata TaxID=2378 RepID=A0A0U1L0W0_9FIRM|nr:hypothetical protein [Sporomusa ovata]EQB27458.1 hypothetical protein SOV_2c03540 [Sporomusa ovata DSM 2662]CQR73302.1 hypothetical protein SpAn4DRAFT_2534 [Sporomusa ovata]